MKKRYINAIILILIILVVGFVALYVGQRFISGHDNKAGHGYDMHHLLHEELHITDEQDQKLAEIEQDFRHHRQLLEEEMRVANRELADAIKENNAYSAEVQQAVDKIHKAMGALQKTTLEHLFEMQPILDEEQNKKLKRLITDALYENANARD